MIDRDASSRTLGDEGTGSRDDLYANLDVVERMKRVIGTVAMLAVLAPTADAAGPEDLAKSKQCFSCHVLDRETHAPSFKLLARNYGGIPNADYMLERKVQLGGVGHWGAEPMPAPGPRPAVSEEEAKELVTWILGLQWRRNARAALRP